MKPALFSANSEGACPNCNGAGVIYTDLAMMAGVAVPCEVCEGKRFQAEVLGYKFAGKDISEVLAMPVVEATEFFGGRQGRERSCAQDPDPARRRRARLPQPRSAAPHALRRRAPAAQAGHSHGGKRVRAGLIYVLDEPTTRLAPRRRRAAARPARPAGRLRQVGDRHRAPPGGHGARRLDHRPRPRRRPRRRPRSSSRARPPTSSPGAPPSPASTSRPTSGSLTPIPALALLAKRRSPDAFFTGSTCSTDPARSRSPGARGRSRRSAHPRQALERGPRRQAHDLGGCHLGVPRDRLHDPPQRQLQGALHVHRHLRDRARAQRHADRSESR